MTNHSPTPGYLDILNACHLIAFGDTHNAARESWEDEQHQMLIANGRLAKDAPEELVRDRVGSRAFLMLHWASRKIERAGREDRLETLVREFHDSTDIPRRNVEARDCWFDRLIDLSGDRMRGSTPILTPTTSLMHHQPI